MSLLNQIDYSYFSNSSSFTPFVIPDGVTEYYYDFVGDIYFYKKNETFTTEDNKIAKAYGTRPNYYVEEINGVFTISGIKQYTATDSVLIEKATELFNKQIDDYKRKLAKKQEENKSNEQKDYDVNIKIEYNKYISYGYDYEKDITSFTYKHHNLVYPVFANGKKGKLVILRYPDYKEMYVDDGSTFLSSQDAWEILKQRISDYKLKIEQNKNTIKKKETEKLNKDIAKPNEIEKKNIEEQPDKKDFKKEIKIESDANKKQVQSAKPKLVIKIPKPFAMGYFIIDLSGMLKNLLGLLSSLALGLLMSKISGLMGDLLSSHLNKNKNINASKITSTLNSIDLKALVQESLEEENLMILNKSIKNVSDISSKQNIDMIYDTQSKLDDSGTYIDDQIEIDDSNTEIEKTNIFKKNKSREIYTMNKRNRQDILNSLEASERLNDVKTNKKSIYNPNYGRYW